MNRFKRILAVYDDGPGGDDVLVQAVALARANGASLAVVNPQGNPKSPEVVDEARRRLRRILPWIAQEGVTDVTTEVLVGTPHVEIIGKVMRDDHDLVVVCAERSSTLKGMLVGSTATKLMLKCPSAVWLLKPGQSLPCSNVVAALQPPLEDRSQDDLNGKILDLASSIAWSDGACLHVVHFWDVEGAEGESIRSELPLQRRRQILDRHEGMRRRALNTLLARHATAQVAHEIHLPRGRPELHMAGMATRLSADLIVMGAECRLGLSRLLMGNFVESVLSSVRFSVLAVKPDEFQTPVAVSANAYSQPGARAGMH